MSELTVFESSYGTPYATIKETKDYRVAVRPHTTPVGFALRVRVEVKGGKLKLTTLKQELNLPDLEVQDQGHSSQTLAFTHRPAPMAIALKVQTEQLIPALVGMLSDRLGGLSVSQRTVQQWLGDQVLGQIEKGLGVSGAVLMDMVPKGLNEENAALYNKLSGECQHKVEEIQAAQQKALASAKDEVADLLGKISSAHTMPEEPEGEDKSEDGDPDEAA